MVQMYQCCGVEDSFRKVWLRDRPSESSIYLAPGTTQKGWEAYVSRFGLTTMAQFNKIAGALALASTIFFAGCRDQSTTVGVIPRTTGTLLWEPMHLGVAEVARQRSLHVYWNAPADEGDTEKQLRFINLSLTRRYRGLIFVPDETLAARSPVLQAIKSGRPVVIVDDLLGPTPGPLLSYVANDEEAGATQAANRLAKILHGSGSIAIVGISPRLQSGVLREESFEKALSSVAPKVRIEVRRYGDSVVTHQQQIAEGILRGPQHIDAVVAMSATATQGVYLAKIAVDPPSPVKIVGFDQGLMLPVQNGDVDSVVVQNTRKIGQIAMQNMDAQLRGEKVSGVTLVPPVLVTAETVGGPEIKRLWEYAHYSWRTQ